MKLYTTLTGKVRELTDAINELIRTMPDSAERSDDATLLQGVSRSQLIGEGINAVSNHATDNNNPHNLTLAQVGGVSSGYVDAALETAVALTDLPVSQFGDTTNDPLGITFSGWTLNFTKPIAAYIQGVSGILAVQNVNLSVIDANPAEKVFHVFLELEDGIPTYQVTLQKLPESAVLMYLGSVYTGTAAIASTSIERVSRLGIYRINHLPAGSSIPVTGGHPMQPNRLDLGWTMAGVSSNYVAYDDAGRPVIASLDDVAGGKIVYDSAFAKLSNHHWLPSYTHFDALSTVFKYLYNAIHWVADPIKVAQGNRKVLALTVGKPTAQWWAKGTTTRDTMWYTLNGWMGVAGFDLTIVDPSDYDGEWVDASLAELEQYCAVLVISNRMAKIGSLTDQCVSSLVHYRAQGGGLIIFGENSTKAVGEIPSLEAARAATAVAHWPATANQIATQFGAWFSGDHGDPSINIGYTRANYGDHPLYAGMDDSENLDLGPSIARVHLVDPT